MGGQGVERREILRYIGMASVAAAFPGFHRWAFACAHSHEPWKAPQAPAGSYQPLFFSPSHYRMVEHLAEMIIPEDGHSPGAHAARVNEYMDEVMFGSSKER